FLFLLLFFFFFFSLSSFLVARSSLRRRHRRWRTGRALGRDRARPLAPARAPPGRRRSSQRACARRALLPEPRRHPTARAAPPRARRGPRLRHRDALRSRGL